MLLTTNFNLLIVKNVKSLKSELTILHSYLTMIAQKFESNEEKVRSSLERLKIPDLKVIRLK